MALHDELQAFFDDYVAKWNRNDSAAMKALWDLDEPEPIYVAEEREPLIGWQALEAYWTGGTNYTHLITYKDLRAKPAAENVAIAFFKLGWNAYIPGSSYRRPIGGKVRASALLRRKSAGWRLFHWIEAPEAAMTQMIGFHERAVDPAFLEILKAKGITYPPRTD